MDRVQQVFDKIAEVLNIIWSFFAKLFNFAAPENPEDEETTIA